MSKRIFPGLVAFIPVKSSAPTVDTPATRGERTPLAATAVPPLVS